MKARMSVLFSIALALAIAFAAGASTAFAAGGDMISLNNAIGAARAMELALETSGGGTVIRCKLDHKKEGLRYEVKIINNGVEHKVKINAETGAAYDYSFKQK